VVLPASGMAIAAGGTAVAWPTDKTEGGKRH
jgi:hypothetical protein